LPKRRTNIEQYDAILAEVAKQLRLIDHIEPINKEEERKRFFSEKDYEPVFRYKELGFDPSHLRYDLESLRLGDSPIETIMRKIKEDFLLKIDLLLNRGNKNFRQISLKLYGKPSPETVKEAEELIEMQPTASTEEVESKEIMSWMEGIIKKHDLPWTVRQNDNLSARARVDRNHKVIEIRPGWFSKREAKRLIVHEFVHLTRSTNAEAQPYRVFALETSKTLKTEEGLALFYESKYSLLDVQLRRYAARTLAVQKMLDGASFRDVFSFLVGKSFPEDEAYEITQRVFRGGGLTKDCVYLEGLRKVRNYLERGGDIRILFAGKVSIEDISLIRALMEEGILKEPAYLPEDVIGHLP